MKTTKPDFNKIPKIKKVGNKTYHLQTAVVTKYDEDKNSPVYGLYNKPYYKKDKTKIKGVTLIYSDFYTKGQYEKAVKTTQKNLKHLEQIKKVELEIKKNSKGLTPLPF